MTELPGKDSDTRKTTLRKQVDRLLLRTAQQLRNTYIFQRRAYLQALTGKESLWLPPRTEKGQKGAPENPEIGKRPDQWLHITRTLMAQKINPIEYVNRIFAGLIGKNRRAPEPGALLSANWINFHRHRSRVAPEEIAVALRSQRQVAADYILSLQSPKVSMLQATIEVLEDDDIPLSALFRYCLAVSMPEVEVQPVARFYQGAAALQYIPSAQIYNRVWKELIPAEFRELAKVLHYEYFRNV